eukprot:1011695-Pleurochrysis_carterae.AAC.1
MEEGLEDGGGLREWRRAWRMKEGLEIGGGLRKWRREGGESKKVGDGKPDDEARQGSEETTQA